MDIVLTPVEARVLGSLIEKETTTPDYYPMSANALMNACNQKSSRDPVMNLSHADVMNAVFELRQKKLVMEKLSHDSRVPKYEHIIFDMFDFTDEELAVICILFLRGPQTPGEIKTRSNRLCEFSSPFEVEETLEGLITKEDGPFVVKLPRQSGRRECRYCHLFCGEVEVTEEPAAEATATTVNYKGNDSRFLELEEKVSSLETELKELKEMFLNFKKEFE